MSTPRVTTMASGNLSITVTEDVSWDTFPGLARAFLRRFGGLKIWARSNPAEHIWIVLVGWRPFFLAYEDFPNQRTLDSMHASCNAVVRKLAALVGAS